MSGSDRGHLVCTVGLRRGRLAGTMEDAKGTRRALTGRAARALVESALAELAEAGHPQDLSLAVLVETEGVAYEDAVRFCAAAIGSAAAAKVSWVAAPPRPWTARAPASLPFRILRSAAATDPATTLEAGSWLGPGEDRGMEVLPSVPVEEGDELRRVLASRPVAVLVTVGAEARAADAVVASLPHDRVPPLHVTFVDAGDPRAPEPPLRGTARMLVAAPRSAWTDALRELAYGIAHDLPLHDVARGVAQRSGRPVSVAVCAAPAALHGLRVSDAIDALADAAGALQPTPWEQAARERRERGRDRRGRRFRVFDDSLFHLGFAARRADLPWRDPSRAATYLRDLVGFSREADGLVPAARWSRHLDEGLRGRAGDVPGDEGPRSVDLAFRRALGPPLRRGERVADLDDLAVGREEPLAAGGCYRLCVRVGRPFDGSLFDAPPPPVDPLLTAIDPRPEHVVDVVLFPLDFAAEDATLRKLAVPARGPSSTVSFGVRAPERAGTARLRVAVYLGNHLVQSYVVRAAVGRWARSARGLGATVEFTRAADLRDAGGLQERSLSIVMNRSGGDHTFQFKDGEGTESVRRNRKAVERSVTAIRAKLQELSADASKPRKFRGDGGRDPAAFDAAIRALAQEGRKLHRELITNNRNLEASLRRVAASCGASIQVLLADPEADYPWALLYDRPLAQDAGALPVCADPACSHGAADDRVVCVRGFWGVRHVVEQYVAFGGTVVRAAPAAWPPANAVRLAVGLAPPAESELRGPLETALGPGSVQLAGPGSRLLDVLWDPASRGPVNVLLGHVTPADDRDWTRIAVAPGTPGEHVSAADLVDRVTAHGEWRPYGGVVLLLGCRSSGAASAELVPLHRAMLRAGAAAVVGCEVDIYDDVASAFGREVVLALGRPQRQPMGEAVRRARAEMLRAKNPLAFAFAAYGDADLRFV